MSESNGWSLILWQGNDPVLDSIAEVERPFLVAAHSFASTAHGYVAMLLARWVSHPSRRGGLVMVGISQMHPHPLAEEVGLTQKYLERCHKAPAARAPIPGPPAIYVWRYLK